MYGEPGSPPLDRGRAQQSRYAATGWRTLNGAKLSLPLYPWMHLAPTGKVFNSGARGTTRYLDTRGTGRWTTVGSTNFGDRHQYEGTSVMYEPGKVMIVGGGNPATASAEVINLSEVSPRWRYTSSMTYRRRYLNATILPDGKILVTGGSRSSAFSDPSGAVYNAEMWDPATESWSTMAAMSTSRLYHSTALLLPDGRVLLAGGGGDGAGGDVDHYNGQYYFPPYLFRGRAPQHQLSAGDRGIRGTFRRRNPGRWGHHAGNARPPVVGDARVQSESAIQSAGVFDDVGWDRPQRDGTVRLHPDLLGHGLEPGVGQQVADSFGDWAISIL